MCFISNTSLEYGLGSWAIPSAPEIITFVVVIHPQAMYVVTCEIGTMLHVTFRYVQDTRLLISVKMKAFLLRDLFSNQWNTVQTNKILNKNKPKQSLLCALQSPPKFTTKVWAFKRKCREKAWSLSLISCELHHTVAYDSIHRGSSRKESILFANSQNIF